MADAFQLPEVFDVDGIAVRVFPAARAIGFPRLPQAARRATPAIIRRVYREAVDVAAQAALCLICGETAPAEGRVMIAVERDGGHELGAVCAACARLGKLDAS